MINAYSQSLTPQQTRVLCACFASFYARIMDFNEEDLMTAARLTALELGQLGSLEMEDLYEMCANVLTSKSSPIVNTPNTLEA